MRRLPGLVLLVIVVSTTGCFHAVVNTGRQASGQTIERPWAHSFIYGLVPPSVTETASACPNGVARVETQQSFLNGLAHVITFGIYTPMTITVACAGGDDEDAPAGADVLSAGGAPEDALNAAVERSRETGEPIWVDFR